VIAVAEVTRLLLPALRSASGQVVLINSTAWVERLPTWGSYAASKFALRAYADALRAKSQNFELPRYTPDALPPTCSRLCAKPRVRHTSPSGTCSQTR